MIGLISGVVIALMVTVIGNFVHSLISGRTRRQRRALGRNRRRVTRGLTQPQANYRGRRHGLATITPGGYSSVSGGESERPPALSLLKSPLSTQSAASTASYSRTSNLRFRKRPFGVGVKDTIYEEDSSLE